jgi:Na+/melibiose symporter-like transporter
MTIYSANNNPYSALSGVITGNMTQRASLSSVRFVVVSLATVAIQGFTLPMVNHFGEGNSSRGYQITMGIFCALAVIFFIITFFTTKERIKPPPQQKSSLKQDLTDLVRNRQWIIMFSVFLLMFIFLSMRNGILVYYFKYYLDIASQKAFLMDIDKVLFGFFSAIGLTGTSADIAGNAFSVINIIGQLAAILGIALSNRLAKGYCKRDIFRIWLGVAGLAALLFVVIPPTSIWLTFILSTLFNFAWGVTMMLPWAMMGDVADYSEWKNNRRATGIVFAGIVVGLKVGMAIGGFLAGKLLSVYGYISNVEQTTSSLKGIRLTVSVYPAIAIVLCIVFLFIYGINRKTEIQMQDELAERRKSYV